MFLRTTPVTAYHEPNVPSQLPRRDALLNLPFKQRRRNPVWRRRLDDHAPPGFYDPEWIVLSDIVSRRRIREVARPACGHRLQRIVRESPDLSALIQFRRPMRFHTVSPIAVSANVLTCIARATRVTTTSSARDPDRVKRQGATAGAFVGFCPAAFC